MPRRRPGTGRTVMCSRCTRWTSEKLGPDADASPAVVGFNLRFHTLGRAQLIAEYEVPARAS